MATDYWASDYDQYTTRQQEIFDAMVDTTGLDEMRDDRLLTAYVDVLFNGDPGELPVGRERDDIMGALEDYLRDQYDLIFEEVWDWDAWREAYGGGGAT